MGLNHIDKRSWQRWQDARRPAHVAKDLLLRRSAATTPHMAWWARGSRPHFLLACDSNSPTNHHSLVGPFSTGDAPSSLLAHPAHIDLNLDSGWTKVTDPDLTPVETLISIGDHLPLGDHFHNMARTHRWRQVIVQHGLLTPFAPPPPQGSHVIVWSEADANYLSEGRPDLTMTAGGSPLLASARQSATEFDHVSRFETPAFLGQLHGAELSRFSMTRSATHFCRTTGATYRPHPREEDKLSRLQHRLWEQMGITVDRRRIPLTKLSQPIVSAFSTGVLEAAARDMPAWVYHLNPPKWLEELWERYGMRRWGQAPTPPPVEMCEVRPLWELF